MNTFLSDFTDAQTKTIQLLRKCISLLEEGMSVNTITQLILAEAQNYGFTGWVRPPLVQIRNVEKNTTTLQKGSHLQIHLQPATSTAFGSSGTTLSFKQDEAPIVAKAKELCKAICIYANSRKCIGELFVFARSWSNNHRGQLTNDQNIGHICLPPSSLTKYGWPKSVRLVTAFRRNQVQWYNPRPTLGIYAIHPFITINNEQAGFAEMVAIDEDNRHVLGRENVEDIGTF